MKIRIYRNVDMKEVEDLKLFIRNKGLQIDMFCENSFYVMGVWGKISSIDINELKKFKFIHSIELIDNPFKRVSRQYKSNDTIIDVDGEKIGGGNFGIIAGPCSVESEEQIINIAKLVKRYGAKFLRGGAFKPRTSPYSFQGLGITGLKMLNIAKKEVGIPIVSEIMSLKYIEFFADNVDIIQVGARNMQNFDLLKQVGKINKPILLKRSFAATIDELLMSAEYIMASGNKNVILCERGIRTFERNTRNTLDLQAVPIIKKLSHLPIIVDPSHASGHSYLVEPMTKAAIVSGGDGVMIEVHDDPKSALCDGEQSITPIEFGKLMEKMKPLMRNENKV